VETYLSQFEPMQRGKMRLALDRQMRLNGRAMFRWQAANELAAGPYLRLDEVKGRLYTSEEGTFFDVSALTKTLVDYTMWIREQEHKLGSTLRSRHSGLMQTRR
jgi:hypothetical protein